ncbi:hypothetical protein Tco_0967788, partial [Tanacetum coccineum]
MWPTCDPDSKFCFGYNEVFGVNEQGTLRLWICFRDHERQTVKGSYIGFAEFLQVRYEQQSIDDTTRERRIGHDNQHESDREFIFNEWILDSYDVKEEYAREIGGRSFICITDHEDEALPLGHLNGAWFKAMIQKELEGSSKPINRCLIQAIQTSLPPQPIGEATKASNLRRIPPGV